MMWITRVVKNGKVKVAGKYFEPDKQHVKYDGRFENKRLDFALYKQPDGPLQYCGEKILDFIYLFGVTDDRDPFAAQTVEKDGQKILPWAIWRVYE